MHSDQRPKDVINLERIWFFTKANMHASMNVGMFVYALDICRFLWSGISNEYSDFINSICLLSVIFNAGKSGCILVGCG